MTPSLAEVRSALWSKFADVGLVSWGIYNRRPIAGSTIWSQHSWANAEDISIPAAYGSLYRMTQLDKISAWIHTQRATGSLPIGNSLWRVADHFDHIHYEGSPKFTGTPPLTLSGMEIRKPMDIVCELGASGLWVKPFQAALNEARTRNHGSWAALTVDGRFGELSVAATRGYQVAAGLAGICPKVGAIDTRTAFLLAEYFRDDA